MILCLQTKPVRFGLPANILSATVWFSREISRDFELKLTDKVYKNVQFF